ncbi:MULTISPECIES: hypothetical protein [unclassified Streptomyces]|uniref:hypothetical protein n=1 Tax=unclassified Streptomyces TaxID=2593676 RepID=UPI002E354515|nr:MULTISPECIES: hypothetical protein [unclassified Streptomyces]WUC68387.1 hypothetical protein OG861_31425 [Streptomyces sp. NBC_00539]
MTTPKVDDQPGQRQGGAGRFHGTDPRPCAILRGVGVGVDGHVQGGLAEAIRAVRTSLGIADIAYAEVDFEAVIRSPDVLAQVRPVLPDLGWWASAGKQYGSSEAGDDPADCLPIQVFDWTRPLVLQRSLS